MFETIAIILIVLWLIGFGLSYTFGGLIHILLGLGIIMLLIGLTRAFNRPPPTLR